MADPGGAAIWSAPMGVGGRGLAATAIVLVIAEQWRPQAFGFAGAPSVLTPNLDGSMRYPCLWVWPIAGIMLR